MPIYIAFEYLDEQEKRFRIDQILGVMHKILKVHNIAQKELILQDVFETVLDHGTLRMVEE